MTLFKNNYRVESARLKGWDYASAGAYFVTFCTASRQPWLGEVSGNDVRLSPLGEIVADEWLRTPLVRPHIELDQWIIMPDHVHGIIVITPVEASRGVETSRDMIETSRRDVSTIPTTPRLQPNSLGAIIGQIKSLCTKRIWAAGFRDFRWQTRFYDRIIRDDQALEHIRAYIVDNPVHWAQDKGRPLDVWV